MLSLKCKYAIRALLHIAVSNGASDRYNTRNLAEDLKMPAPFLSKILQELVPKKLVSSTKGPNGGFYLTEENLDTPLIRIVEQIDGLAFFNDCGLGLSACSDEKPCPLHSEFKIARDHLHKTLTSQTLRSLAKDTKTRDLILVR
jgi:Rrf2 family protein